MNTAQKIIKYCAIGLAAAIIVGIFSAILAGGFGIAKVTDYLKGNQVEVTCETEPCLKVALGRTDLEIKKGEKFAAETNYGKVEIKQDGNKILIEEKDGDWLKDDHRVVTVTVPGNLEFETVGISGGVGKTNIEFLKTKNLELSVGVGETNVAMLDVQNAKINTGVGALKLNLAGAEQDYEIKVRHGIGDIRVNDKELGRDTVLGSGEHKVEINGGIGEVIVKTK